MIVRRSRITIIFLLLGCSFFGLTLRAQNQSQEPSSQRPMAPQLELRKPAREVEIYRVKPGDSVYRILRREFGILGKNEIYIAFKQVRELNPSKKNWDFLLVGEALRFPAQPGAQPSLAKQEEKRREQVSQILEEPKGFREGNWTVLDQLAQLLGATPVRSGEEVFHLQEGKITVDRAIFPVFTHPTLGRRVVVDTRGIMPPALKARIETEAADTSVLAIKRDSNMRDIGAHVLAGLGYQTIPVNRPLVFQDRGVGIQVRGDWMIMIPEATGGREQIWVFLLTERPEKMPGYLEDYLASKGIKLTQIVQSSSSAHSSPSQGEHGNTVFGGQVERLPADKTALLDGVLRRCEFAFAQDHELSLPLRDGIKLNIRLDRYLESRGKKIGVVFSKLSVETRKALGQIADLSLIEIDMKALSTREVIARVLTGLGETSAYAEHRFSAADIGRLKESVVLSVWGFFVPSRSLLLTDRVVPPDVERFLISRGIQITYFQ